MAEASSVERGFPAEGSDAFPADSRPRTRGPVEVVVLTFPADTSREQVAAVVKAMTASEAVVLVDLVLLTSEDGEAVAVDIETAGDPAFADIELEPATVISGDDLEGVAASMSADEVAAVLVVEHRWALRAKEQLEAARGTLALHLRVAPEDADAAFLATDEKEN